MDNSSLSGAHDPAQAEKINFFLAASHQLKSPVAIMQWCLQSLSESTDLSNDNRYMVQKALEQANGMSQLIGDMLQVFRYLRGDQSTIPRGRVVLVPLLETVIKQYETIAASKQVGMEIGTIENLGAVMAQESMIKQVFINLLDNAIKYTPAGKRVMISAARPTNDRVMITFADEGIGISELEQKRLFTEFFRGAEAKEVTSDGTGLGLVLARKVIESVGGTISVHSELHKGTKFIVSLPVIA
jgi:signal transduction histidine kinase